jgi:hypothetical protein
MIVPAISASRGECPMALQSISAHFWAPRQGANRQPLGRRYSKRDGSTIIEAGGKDFS